MGTPPGSVSSRVQVASAASRRAWLAVMTPWPDNIATQSRAPPAGAFGARAGGALTTRAVRAGGAPRCDVGPRVPDRLAGHWLRRYGRAGERRAPGGCGRE